MHESYGYNACRLLERFWKTEACMQLGMLTPRLIITSDMHLWLTHAPAVARFDVFL
jgi:hypothetical protein